MMSEELFDKSNDDRIRQNGLIMTTDEVVDLLNSQSKLISAYQYEFVKMRKENEQLLKENVFLAKQRNYWKGKSDMAVETFEIDEANAKQIRKLEKENEKLKKRINLISDELYCKDRKLEELGIPIECCDKDE